LFVVVVPLLLH